MRCRFWISFYFAMVNAIIPLFLVVMVTAYQDVSFDQHRQPKTTDHAEKLALHDLFLATGGSNWKNWVNWRHGDPCKLQWSGLTCVLDDNLIYHITRLSLPGNNLEGVIPTSLFNLRWLEHLNLSRNALSSAIPLSLTGLHALR